MKHSNPEVDAYIENAADFAQPILRKIRRLVHKGCPEVRETIKWSSPHFDYQGIMMGMASFKAHINLGFWKGAEMSDPESLFAGAMGKTCVTAIKISKISELPSDKILLAYVKEAAKLNAAKLDAPKKKAGKKKVARKQAVPSDLGAALKKNRKAHATFEGFSNSHQNEYIEWLSESKQEATRNKRLAQAIEWMAEGKPRNWKYMKKW